jgi:ABC-2 type transport system permease protein
MLSIRRVIADLDVTSRQFLRSRVGVFFSLIFPIVIMLIFGAIFSGGNGAVTAYVQNNDNALGIPTQTSAAFMSALNSTKVIQLVPVSPGTNFTQFLLSHSSSDGIVIPDGFQVQFLAGKPVNISVYGSPASQTSAIVSGVATQVVNQFNLYRAGGNAVINVASLTLKSTGTKYIDFLIPGLVGFSILTAPMFSLVNISSQYKRDKLFKQLSLTPLTRGEWLLSKVIWYIVITVAAFVLMTLVGEYAFGAHVTLSLYILPFLAAGPFLFVSLGMLVGTASNSPESAAIVGQLITFPMMFLSGTFFPISVMPTWLQTVAHVFPLFYVVEGLTSVMTYGNVGPAMIDLIVILVIAVVVFVAAVHLFKWRED